MQRAFRYPPESICPATASTTSTSVPQCANCAAVRSGSPCDAEDGNSSQESQTRGTPCHSPRAAMSAPRGRADMAQPRAEVLCDDPGADSPRVTQGAGTGAGRGVRGKLAVDLGEQRHAAREAKLAAGRRERGVLRRRGAVDDEARAR